MRAKRLGNGASTAHAPQDLATHTCQVRTARLAAPTQQYEDVVSRFTFATPGRPLVVEVAASDGDGAQEERALIDALTVILPEWRASAGGEAASIRVERRGGGFSLSYSGLPQGPVELEGIRAAAEALSGALTSCFVQQDSRQLHIHAGAVALASGVVLLYGPSLSGKSSLALQSVRLGAALAADDQIAVTVPVEGSPQAITLGVTPRLRMPLPPQAGEDFAAFVSAHVLRAEGGVTQLRLERPAEQLPFGTHLPVRALVALERRDAGAIELSPLGAGAALRGLFDCLDAPHLGAESLTRRLHKLVRRVPCYRLAFANSRQAASLLLERFERGKP